MHQSKKTYSLKENARIVKPTKLLKKDDLSDEEKECLELYEVMNDSDPSLIAFVENKNKQNQ